MPGTSLPWFLPPLSVVKFHRSGTSVCMMLKALDMFERELAVEVGGNEDPRRHRGVARAIPTADLRHRHTAQAIPTADLTSHTGAQCVLGLFCKSRHLLERSV